MISRYNINRLSKDVSRKLHGTGVQISADFLGAVDEGRREVISKVQPRELKRIAFIENALYDQIDRYAVPSDMQYENVNDIRMLASRRNLDSLEHPLEMVYEKRFDQKRQNAANVFSINYADGVKYMKINHPRGLRQCQHLVIQDFESLNENGTFNVGGNIGNLTLDRLDHIAGKASLRFDIDATGTTGFIENFTMKAVDISEFMQLGAIFTWLDITKINVLTSVTLRFGSSLTDYYEFAVNQPHDGNEFLPTWNLLRFPLEGLTQVGFPNIKQITYFRLELTTTGTTPVIGCHVDNIVARKGVVYQTNYNSAFMFADETNQAWKQFATKNTDLIIAEEDTYQLLLLETTKVVMQGSYDNTNKSQDDIGKIDLQLQQKYVQYKRLHKQDAIEAFDSMYVFGDMYSGYTDDPMNRYESGSWDDNNNNC